MSYSLENAKRQATKTTTTTTTMKREHIYINKYVLSPFVFFVFLWSGFIYTSKIDNSSSSSSSSTIWGLIERRRRCEMRECRSNILTCIRTKFKTLIILLQLAIRFVSIVLNIFHHRPATGTSRNVWIEKFKNQRRLLDCGRRNIVSCSVCWMWCVD